MKIIQTGFNMSVEGGFWFGLQRRSSWNTASQIILVSQRKLQHLYFAFLICYISNKN
jgi:hypothetical protein